MSVLIIKEHGDSFILVDKRDGNVLSVGSFADLLETKDRMIELGFGIDFTSNWPTFTINYHE